MYNKAGDILLVEDDAAFAHLTENFLVKKGYTIVKKGSVKEGIEASQKKSFQLVLLDYNLPDGNAFDFISKLRLNRIKVPVIIMTNFDNVRTAVKAIHSGALNYVIKPLNSEELLMLVKQAIEPVAQNIGASEQRKQFIKGLSNVSRELNKHIELVSPTNMSVMIEGESGTGKENIARTIHGNSPRASGPFVAIDCGALTDELASSELFGHVKGSFTGAVSDKKGEFEMAHNGTLFLDEIGNLSYSIQVKLLRAIQEMEIQPLGSTTSKKVNVRVITATNDDLKSGVQKGLFREDLFHRLNEFRIYVPPLRERIDDLALFCDHFLTLANAELESDTKGISEDVMSVFKSYDWPGNLRELKNIIKRSVLMARAEYITVKDIPADMFLPIKSKERPDINNLKLMNEENEKALILKILQQVKFNKTKAANLLKIDRTTLYTKLARYGIDT
jgi:two-component system, NtrC family, response regulator HydG